MRNLLFVKTWIPFTQGRNVSSSVEIGQMILDKILSIFLLFSYYISLEKGMTLHLKKILNPLHSKLLCSKFV